MWRRSDGRGRASPADLERTQIQRLGLRVPAERVFKGREVGQAGRVFVRLLAAGADDGERLGVARAPAAGVVADLEEDRPEVVERPGPKLGVVGGERGALQLQRLTQQRLGGGEVTACAMEHRERRECVGELAGIALRQAAPIAIASS